jgi:hypothetical protein
VAGAPTLSGSVRSVADAARPGPNEWSVTATDCAGNDTTSTGSAIAAVTQDGALRYAGSWATARSSAAYGGTYRSAKAAGGRATTSVTARSVALVATRAANQGSVRVHVDGKLVATVSLYAKTATARQVVWTYAWPTAGRHTVTITNVATKGRPTVNVDAILTLS